MSVGRDLHDLVGDDCSSEELARIRLAHELLVAADPPPSAADRLGTHTNRTTRSQGRRRLALPRRRSALVAVAAAMLLVGVGIGYVARGGRSLSGQSVAMRGVGEAKKARATVLVGTPDQSGNWPLLLTVHGLKTLPTGGWYTLYLTKNGKPIASCGTFRTDPKGLNLRLNAPYDLGRFSGWVVTVHLPRSNQAGQVVLTTLT